MTRTRPSSRTSDHASTRRIASRRPASNSWSSRAIPRCPPAPPPRRARGPLTGIGIFRLRYPVGSETFIREQAGALTRYRPTVFTRQWGPGPPSETPAVVIGGRGRGIPSRAARALYALTGAPRLFGKRAALPEVGLIHAHFAPDATYALPLAEWLGVPLVSTFHGWDVTVADRALLREPSITVAHYLYGRAGLRARGAAFIAVSDYIRDPLLALGYPADGSSGGTSGRRRQVRAVSGPRRERYVLNAARHREQKGIDTLLEASPASRPAPQCHAHPGRLRRRRGRFVRSTASLRLTGRVRFLGH